MNTVKTLKAIADDSIDSTNPKIIPSKTFFEELANSIKERSFCSVSRKDMSKAEKFSTKQQYFESLSQYSLHDKKFWPKDRSLLYGEDGIRQFSEKYGHSTVKMLSEFRIFKETDIIGDEFKLYVDHVMTYSISSADAERGFSAMNRILTDSRNKLFIENVSSLMLINRIRMPIEEFNPDKYVKVWMRGHQNAESMRNSTR